MDICEHCWVRVHEQSILGGSFPVGWQCEKCNKYIANSQLTPDGLAGTVTKRHKLVGIHGGNINTESGKQCKEQIYDEETKKITYQ